MVNTNILSVGIREENRVEIYSEKSSFPVQIIDWKNGIVFNYLKISF